MATKRSKDKALAFSAENDVKDLTKIDRVIVVGASAGGVPAITKLIASLPESFDSPVFIVWHMAPDVTGLLPRLINNCTHLNAANAVNNEPIRRERIYIAPPDHHMIIQEGYVRISKGPKENRFRPAIDPLFRSAAYAYGSSVTGIILTGGLDDGTAGAWAIKQAGGVIIIQNPEEAEVPSMPENALKAVKADHVAKLTEIGSLLVNQKTAVPLPLARDPEKPEINKELARSEINVLLQNPGETIFFGNATQYACPECHGVLSAIKEGKRTRYRCHTGHAYSKESLLALLESETEGCLRKALRGVTEMVLLLNEQGDLLASVNKPKEAGICFRKAIEAREQAYLLKQMLKKEQG